MKIVVIDGQGGRLGRLLIERVKARLPQAQVYALGTNSVATAAMLKAGADFGATGENPVESWARWESWWRTPSLGRSRQLWQRPWAAAGPKNSWCL